MSNHLVKWLHSEPSEVQMSRGSKEGITQGFFETATLNFIIFEANAVIIYKMKKVLENENTF